MSSFTRIFQIEQLLKRQLQKAAEDECSWVIRFYESIGSTMDVAREILELVSPGRPGLVLTRQQQKGRGRQGRCWEEPGRGFYGTYVFAVDGSFEQCAGFSLVAGVAVSSSLEEKKISLQLKWPNDLVSAEGEKTGGILIELVRRGDRGYVLVGIGLNLDQPPGTVESSTSLKDLSGTDLSIEETALLMSYPLYLSWKKFLDQGFEPYRDEWRKRAIYLNSHLCIDTGNEILEGIFRDIGPGGILLLESDSGIREILSGHVLSIDKPQLPHCKDFI